MINKKNILAIISLLCLTFTQAEASSLVRMDINKVSDNALDVTFFTTENASNPMVTRKSNNKYVVLMPNVAGKNAGTPDLSAVKDIVSDVNIKHVDDGLGGYTKVTFITSKPLNIKTHVSKSAPLSKEENDAKAVIAQTKTHPKQTVAPVPPRKEVAKTTVTSSAVSPKVETVKSEPKKVTDVKPADNVKNIDKIEKKSVNLSKVSEASTSVETKVDEVSDAKFDVNEIEKIEKISHQNNETKKLPLGWMLFAIPLFVLYLLAKVIRSSVQGSGILSASFKEHLDEKPLLQQNYDDIIENDTLNWQEKYKKFVEESNGEIKNRKYTFISTPNTMSEIDEKRIELENTLNKTPEIYEEQQIDLSSDEISEVQSEDEIISNNMVKLKAFAKPVSLHKAQRNRVKKSLPKVQPQKEGKFVKLQQTPLTSGKRRFSDANLKVSDLVKSGSAFINGVNEEMFEKKQNYLMSSIDEYFSLLDKEKTMTNPNKDLSSKIAESLAQVKPSMYLRKEPSSGMTSNPIAKKSTSSLNGLVVKSGYNIDENRGFYLVSLDGTTALVGRVNEEIFVLKKFDENVDKLQVRPDSENVYMVKAGDFKSLVDVDEKQMGVLIEL